MARCAFSSSARVTLETVRMDEQVLVAIRYTSDKFIRQEGQQFVVLQPARTEDPQVEGLVNTAPPEQKSVQTEPS